MTRDEIESYLDNLIKIGKRIIDDPGPENELVKEHTIELANTYQSWYSKSMLFLKTYLPERYEDFINLYKPKKPVTKLTKENYTISDFFSYRKVFTPDPYGFDPYGEGTIPVSTYLSLLNVQVAIMNAANDIIISRYDELLQSFRFQVYDDELATAQALLKEKLLRPAGVIAGVILERHLKSIILNHEISVKYRNPGLNDYNQALKDNAVYDTVQWRKITYLADIRHKCAHPKEAEPTKEEVLELINGTDNIIKTIF